MSKESARELSFVNDKLEFNVEMYVVGANNPLKEILQSDCFLEAVTLVDDFSQIENK